MLQGATTKFGLQLQPKEIRVRNRSRYWNYIGCFAVYWHTLYIGSVAIVSHSNIRYDHHSSIVSRPSIPIDSLFRFVFFSVVMIVASDSAIETRLPLLLDVIPASDSSTDKVLSDLIDWWQFGFRVDELSICLLTPTIVFSSKLLDWSVLVLLLFEWIPSISLPSLWLYLSGLKQQHSDPHMIRLMIHNFDLSL